MWIDYEFHEFPAQYRIIREIRFFHSWNNQQQFGFLTPNPTLIVKKGMDVELRKRLIKMGYERKRNSRGSLFRIVEKESLKVKTTCFTVVQMPLTMGKDAIFRRRILRHFNTKVRQFF